MDSRPPLEAGHDYKENDPLSSPRQTTSSRHSSQRSHTPWAAPSASSSTEPQSPRPGLTLPPMSSLLEAVRFPEPRPLQLPPLGFHLPHLRGPKLSPLSSPPLPRAWFSASNLSYRENPYCPQGRSTLPEMSTTLSPSSELVRSGFAFMSQPPRQTSDLPELMGSMVQDQPASPFEPSRPPLSPAMTAFQSPVAMPTMEYSPTSPIFSTAWSHRPASIHAVPMSFTHSSSTPTLPPMSHNMGAPHTHLGALTLESTREASCEADDLNVDPSADAKLGHGTQRPLRPLINTQPPSSPRSLVPPTRSQASATMSGTRGKSRKGQFVTRTRLYVSKACINCRNSKVACENARPCQRCVRLNKADTCVDAASKRRGRPGNAQFASSPLDPNDDVSNALALNPSSRTTGVSSAPIYRVSLPATRAYSHHASAMDTEPLVSATSTLVLTPSAATITPAPFIEPAKPANFKFRIKSVQHFSTGTPRRADEDGFIHYLSTASTGSGAQTSESGLTHERTTPASPSGSTASFSSAIPRSSLALDAGHASYQHILTTTTTVESRTRFLLKTPESFESPYLRTARDDNGLLPASKAAGQGRSLSQTKPLIFNCTTPANFNANSPSAQRSPNLRPNKAARVKAITPQEVVSDELRPVQTDHLAQIPSNQLARLASPILPRTGPMALSSITDPFNTEVCPVRRSSSAERQGPVSAPTKPGARDSHSSPSSMPSEDEMDIAHFLLTNSQKHHPLSQP